MQLVYKGGAAIATIEALFVRLALKPIVDLLVLGMYLDALSISNYVTLETICQA